MDSDTPFGFCLFTLVLFRLGRLQFSYSPPPPPPLFRQPIVHRKSIRFLKPVLVAKPVWILRSSIEMPNDQAHRVASFGGDPAVRLVTRVVFRASSINDRRAVFTASSLGNALATSGLRTTTFDDSRIRFAYLPRTSPSGKSERLYSARNSSLSGALFFI
jgi:hypothetical protein